MDANGTHFHLLFGHDNWAACLGADGKTLGARWTASPPASDGMAWDARAGEITLQQRAFHFVPAKGDRAPELADRRGAARDAYGSWYWIADATEIRVRSAGSDAVTRFWPPVIPLAPPATRPGEFRPKTPPAPAPACEFSGLTVTEDHYLVAGAHAVRPDGGPARLLIFDLHAGGPPDVLLWPAGVPFSPYDCTPRKGGGVWILDRANRRLWGLDRYFQVLRAGPSPAPDEAEDFAPAGPPDAGRADPPPAPLTLDAAAPVLEADPIALEALPDGSVLVLDRPSDSEHSRVARYRGFVRIEPPVSLGTIANWVRTDKAAGFLLVAHDFAYSPAAKRLFVVSSEGNQAFAFDFAADDGPFLAAPAEVYFPLRLFTGKAIVAAGGEIYYDLAERWLPLVEQPRPRYIDAAELTTYVLDSETPDCVWHRVMLDVMLPADAGIEVWSRAGNDRDALDLVALQSEPRPVRRGMGSELPFLAGAGIRPTHELLLQRAGGRHLQLRLRFSGNGRVTPRLRALRVYYPRFSYLRRYLPACYRDDAESASFLERFLANLEGTFTTIEDRIAAVQLLLDARSAPREVLDWLAAWFGVAMDPAWPPRKKRLFIAHAMTFFQWRGTAHGLRMALRLAFDACPTDGIFTDLAGATPAARRFRIVEKFRTRHAPGIIAGDASAGPQQILPLQRWQPAQGADNLHQRYRDALGTADAGVLFPLSPPADADGQKIWQAFSLGALGFLPAVTTAADDLWTQFLQRRYLGVARLPAAYGSSVSAFPVIPRPAALPADRDQLKDWFLFESVVLATRATAHTFRVLLPVRPALNHDNSQRLRELQLASRLIELEKPAHTLYDVKFYWALFRVGEARLGEDTQIGQGSRAPELLPPLILGEAALAENYLSPRHPFDVRHRLVLGRDRLHRIHQSPKPTSHE